MTRTAILAPSVDVILLEGQANPRLVDDQVATRASQVNHR